MRFYLLASNGMDYVCEASKPSDAIREVEQAHDVKIIAVGAFVEISEPRPKMDILTVTE